MQRDILVYAEFDFLKEAQLIGILHAEHLRGKEIFSFEYDKEWLESKYVQVLDPDLQLYKGIQYLKEEDNKPNFGMFLDSSPDRWGRVLMKRREAVQAKLEKRTINNLFELDFLLGVYDENRMGALRFKESKEGEFLNNNKSYATPPWASLRELEQICLKIEDDGIENEPDYVKWLDLLLAPGSSLGGARPKASVMDAKNQLWIAKFPNKNDEYDVGAWEMTVYELAKNAGVNMSECMLQQFTGKHHTFLTKRFDRTDTGKRIHFASAMTLLGYNDGQNHTAGVSYLELADFITKHGANIKEDLEQLWRRIVFSICVSNTDDHLRNHGFILTDKGWVLSPAYDINPIETGTGLQLNITENDNSLSLELAMEVHTYFRLENEKAEAIIQEVRTAVKKWRQIASKYGISKAEQDLKARAFLEAE